MNNEPKTLKEVAQEALKRPGNHSLFGFHYPLEWPPSESAREDQAQTFPKLPTGQPVKTECFWIGGDS